MVAELGRNSPCPCGSGKKYKKCCQPMMQSKLARHGIDTFQLNKEMAYKGIIGRSRAAYCEAYIARKATLFEVSRTKQEEAAAENNETISCQINCVHCCYLYTQANPQECEAIVYYLYQNERALDQFLAQYLVWREEIRKKGDIFVDCDELAQEFLNNESEEALAAYYQESTRYHQQNIPCPFLHNDRCIIYPVRPFTCAGMAVSSPPEWCHYLSQNRPKVYPAYFQEMLDTSFYYKSLPGIFAQCMPVMVYSILKNGYAVLENIPGLEDIGRDAASDPEVKEIHKRFKVV